LPQQLSKNCGARRGSAKPDYVMIHYTDLPTASCAIEMLCHERSGVSAHYVVTRWGQIINLVHENKRAWHAGVGSWHGIRDMNSRSIGIELDYPGIHSGAKPYPDIQLSSLLRLLKGIFQRWDIRPEHVIGHSDYAPDRKIDPGSFFPWGVLAMHGFAISPPSHMVPTNKALDELLVQFGYDVPMFGVPLCKRAFQNRFLYGQSVSDDICACFAAAILDNNMLFLK